MQPFCARELFGCDIKMVENCQGQALMWDGTETVWMNSKNNFNLVNTAKGDHFMPGITSKFTFLHFFFWDFVVLS